MFKENSVEQFIDDSSEEQMNEHGDKQFDGLNHSGIADYEEMYVTKRDGRKEIISFDKILNRLRSLGQKYTPILKINYTMLAMKVIDQLFNHITTTEIDELASEQCATMTSSNPDYGILAGRIVVSSHQKKTNPVFSQVVEELYECYDSQGEHTPVVNNTLKKVVSEYSDKFNQMIVHSRDYLIDYFGFKTLERSYLLRSGGIKNDIKERIQHMWLRVAIGIHFDETDVDADEIRLAHKFQKVRETYDLMSQKYYTHATPTLFNAGTPRQQLSSCYLIAMEDDSLEGIFDTLKDCARISKWAGGIGLHIHNIRANNSLIRGTNGQSSGIAPMLKVFNDTARFINQGGKRNGSFAIYLEPWHPDIEIFLEMRKNHGDEEMRARDLFYALWVPDLFMQRVNENADWSLFCPRDCPGLSDTWGERFEELYTGYENEGRARKVMKARDLWLQILDSQMETGTPYLLYKDACNRKSNQQNLGTIKSSNLCVASETLVLTDKGHIKIRKLEGKQVNVWNGEEFSEVTVFKTGVDQDLIDVHTDDGSVLSCTPYHKFHIQLPSGIVQVEAKDLKPDDQIIQCSFPVISGDAFCDMDSHLVPEYNCSIRSKLDWFSKYCDASESVSEGGDLQVYFRNKEGADKIKLFLQTCGINPKVKMSRDKYTSITFYRLKIDPDDLQKLLELGFSPKPKESPIDMSSSLAKDKCCNNAIKILKVEYNNRMDDTYCFTEPKRHMGVFNGILTGQCTEIIEYSDSSETAVCNLASISLPTFCQSIPSEIIFPPQLDFKELERVTREVTYNLNRIIDINFYPTEKTERSNFRHRPIGIGVQGLADVFLKMDLAFESQEARKMNCLIFETIYYAAVDESCRIAETRYNEFIQYAEKYIQLELVKEEKEIRVYDIVISFLKEELSSSSSSSIWTKYDKINLLSLTTGQSLITDPNESMSEQLRRQICTWIGAYSTFEGSPVSNGILQFDMWQDGSKLLSNRYDWDALKQRCMKFGIRNSLLLAPMPTASTSQILGNNECFEPLTSNIYTRRTLAGEFVVVNRYLVEELIELGLWNDAMKNSIIANYGSIQHIEGLSEHMKNKYKIVWEMSMRALIDMAKDRGAFICQSQSLNLWLEDPSYKQMTSMHMYSWKAGLKTGIYYLRRKAKHNAQQFTVEPVVKGGTSDATANVATNGGGTCEMCSA